MFFRGEKNKVFKHIFCATLGNSFLRKERKERNINI